MLQLQILPICAMNKQQIQTEIQATRVKLYNLEAELERINNIEPIGEFTEDGKTIKILLPRPSSQSDDENRQAGKILAKILYKYISGIAVDAMFDEYRLLTNKSYL